jgi:hypothetical protein
MRDGKSSSVNNNLAVDRLAHNPKVGGSNPPPATNPKLHKTQPLGSDCTSPKRQVPSAF